MLDREKNLLVLKTGLTSQGLTDSVKHCVAILQSHSPLMTVLKAYDRLWREGRASWLRVALTRDAP
jgi:hypothetical protein